MNVCDPAAALLALPPNCPGNPNCGAATAAQTTANNTMKTFILNLTVDDKNSRNSKKFKIKLSENSILLGFLYSAALETSRCSVINKKKQETHKTRAGRKKTIMKAKLCAYLISFVATRRRRNVLF